MKTCFLLIVSFCASPASVVAQWMQLPSNIREWYRNPDGSCVQCSLGMAGVWVNMPQASTLLWDTSYGPAERGGSWPERVSRYATARQIPIYNVTGEPTIPWMIWATQTGRGAGMAFGTAHFQTLYGRDPATGDWFVCDNNSPQRIDRYTHEQFVRIHRMAGMWCVILNKTPTPDVPIYRRWW